MKIAVRARHRTRREHGPWETCFVLALLASAAAPVAAPATPRRIDSDANQIRSESKSNVPPKFWDASHVTYPPDHGYIKTLQDRVPSSTPHPCEANSDNLEMRSKTRPTSVHRLRPGDIDVISAMGDSLVTANGARETTAMGIFIDDRGVSFLGGGQGTWHEFTTLPNIIKVFNPNLRGYAYGRGLLSNGEGALNVAGPGTRTADLLLMSKLFVQRMKKDNNYDFENDWKMLNILTGHNNVCTFECYEKERHSPEAHKRDLQEALDYLYENVPRLYVNILPVIDATINPRTTSGIVCSIIRRLGCRCMYTESSYEEGVHKLSTTVRKYQAAEMELVFGGRYDGREDFTVEWQPFIRSLNAPEHIGDPEDPVLLRLLKREERIWTMDCFHFNQRGHMTMAIQLWNNMMEPVGNKSETFSRFLINQYRCPNKEHPYLFTKKNSETFMKEGHQ
ncbi:phospholipase B1, membrane-associated-like [Ischnura elegans]|uniref:phospholipase B1, membrane-associated-like n=1 Tax=Ischnura elegans TaxID=197161 RepID=UPI001ED882C5|nr:phospholipase B1, membrane-associated-like [Ischnura elegans]